MNPILGALGPLLQLGTEIMRFVNTKEAHKYADGLVDVRTQLLEELSKGYDSDDAKIENLLKQAKILLEAMVNVARTQSTQPSSS